MEILVCINSLGHVKPRRDHHQAVLRVNRGKTDVHRELSAISTPSGQLHAGPHGPGLRVGEVSRPVLRIDLPERLQHQRVDGLAHQVGAVIAEQQLGLTADKTDHAPVVTAHHRMRGRLQQTFEVRPLRRHPVPFEL
jgi:hypothetical protein